MGVLSMQRVLNYGSFLQAYALKQLLLRNGADEVYFIDIEKGRILPGYEPVSRRDRALKGIRYLCDGRLKTWIKDQIYLKRVTRKIALSYPLLESKKPKPSHYDLVVIGSDEVFNCCQPSSWGYTLQLYGRIANADRIVSYAGSFGHTTFKQLQEQNICAEIADAMKSMHSISVRDLNSSHIVKALTGITPELHLDPVLIYGYAQKITSLYTPQKEPYILVYTYPGRVKQKAEIEQITGFARSKGLKLASVFCRYDWCDRAMVLDNPFEVLRWFKDAGYVITDTFHGTIFSIITKRKFCTFIRDKNRQKISSLLSFLRLEERAAYDISPILEKEIDYTIVDEILGRERVNSMQFLKSAFD